jgi:predicted NAD/FAD-dependent oxidoreductase
VSTSPGPWRLDSCDGDILAADGEVVARKNWSANDGDGSFARWQADRVLIAAAPEMAALLSKLCARFQEVTSSIRAAPLSAAGMLWYSFAFDMEAEVRALIAKLDAAKGG